MADNNNNDLDLSDSDPSDGGQTGGRKTKRRRLHGACDTCRRKKVKCDSAIMPNNVCTNCVNSKVECTHNIPRQKKKDTQLEYIQTLEERLRKMEELLRMSPSESHSSKGPSSPESFRGGSPSSNDANTYPDLPIPVPRSVPGVRAESPSSAADEVDGTLNDDFAHIALAERIKSLSMKSVEDRFFGQSSMFAFAQQAANARREYGNIPPCGFTRVRRPYFWNLREYENDYVYEAPQPNYVFPEPDLMANLINIFFERVHIITPALHRQTFERDVQAKLHLAHPQFAMVVLAVCALASRHCDDPRVFMDELDSDGLEGSSAGWKYMMQIPIWRNTLCDRTTHYDMQYYALASLYFIGTAVPQTAWSLTGLGLRLALERGLHRRKAVGYQRTVQNETETRAFWCLIACDRIQSSFLGRPSCLHDEDIDCDYPVECDDEYWETEDPADAFKQPPGKPSYTSFFTYNLKLCEILGFMTRTLYSTKKSKIMSGLIGEDWESRIVSELDLSLNKWNDSLPPHLVWDPANPNFRFYSQALYLHVTFRYIQIQVHRPFLKGNSQHSLTSLAICTNAARACSHAVETSMTRLSFSFPNSIMSTFVSAMVLIVNFWSSHQSKISYDPVQEMADIEKCRSFLAQAEKRWFVAGRLRDMVTEFSMMRAPPSMQGVSGTSNKRSRDGVTAGDMDVPCPGSLPHIDTSSTQRQQPFDQHNIHGQNPKPTSHPFLPAYPNPPFQPTGEYQGIRTALHANNEWDLGSLLFAQMGYDQPLGNNFPVPAPSMVSTPLGDPSALNPQYNVGNGPMDTWIPPSFLTANPMGPAQGGLAAGGGHNGHAEPQLFDVSSWMTTPDTFSMREWDDFVASMGPSPAQPLSL